MFVSDGGLASQNLVASVPSSDGKQPEVGKLSILQAVSHKLLRHIVHLLVHCEARVLYIIFTEHRIEYV